MEIIQTLDAIWTARFAVLQGLWNTVHISGMSIFLGTILGVVVGLFLTYGNLPARLLIRIYSDFLRGTPVFVLILACFYILSVVGVDLSAFEAGVFALTLFCSSHVGEIVRGALQAIPKGQTEAARACSHHVNSQPTALKKFRHSCGVNIWQTSPIAFQTSSKVLAPAFLR